MITASILKSRGYHDLVNIEGGFDAIQEAGMKTSEYVCPSTML
jgi:rhodanese-related sulfurtransferase